MSPVQMNFRNRGLHSMSPVQMKRRGGVFFYLVGSRLPNFPRLWCFRVVNIAPFFATGNKGLWVPRVSGWDVKFYKCSEKVAQFCFLE